VRAFLPCFFVLVFVLVLVIDPSGRPDYEEEDENEEDWRAQLGFGASASGVTSSIFAFFCRNSMTLPFMISS
jgi:hypothetical protein